MMGISDCNSNDILGYSRNYASLNFNIDSLRNPNFNGICRGATKESPLQLISSGDYCVNIAISTKAKHIGPCSLEYFDISGNVITLNSYTECIKALSLVTCNKPGYDMCTYKLDINLNKIQNIDGYIRWFWQARHITPFENFENCIDISQLKSVDSQEKVTEKPDDSQENDKIDYNDSQEKDTEKTVKKSIIKSCNHGSMECKGDGYNTCVWGEWIYRDCSIGTICNTIKNSIICNRK
jgi:hypothetical protein